jgi:TetR/AcrR family transcriptional regulator, copper-responsive repressor
MGRPKKFSRDGVLEKAIPVFWEHGFADTSLQDLELATGVNKSGLYAEFASKEDLFLASLRHYLQYRDGKELLTATPLGWHNIEAFLKLCLSGSHGRRGCFSVSSIREFAVLPSEAQVIVAESRARIRRFLVRNIEAEHPRMDAGAIADLISVFFDGICTEQNLKGSKESFVRKIDNFMQAIRAL